MEAQVKADKVVDARGAQCPGPLVELIRAIKEVPVGSIVEVWTQEPRTKEDAKAWCQRSGHEFIGAFPADGYERVLVRKMK
ncbi:MAG: sulfurtransferase TusA family protein [Armatimonadetes bacterium]|nr:sulfurtransferase TusA family protein [Armatimonadota bacterium]MDW8027666.1 sulfurtransferase TusA family protein [Armatimonadota bacterium]